MTTVDWETPDGVIQIPRHKCSGMNSEVLLVKEPDMKGISHWALLRKWFQSDDVFSAKYCPVCGEQLK